MPRSTKLLTSNCSAVTAVVVLGSTQAFQCVCVAVGKHGVADEMPVFSVSSGQDKYTIVILDVTVKIRDGMYSAPVLDDQSFSLESPIKGNVVVDAAEAP